MLEMLVAVTTKSGVSSIYEVVALVAALIAIVVAVAAGLTLVGRNAWVKQSIENRDATIEGQKGRLDEQAIQITELKAEDEKCEANLKSVRVELDILRRTVTGETAVKELATITQNRHDELIAATSRIESHNKDQHTELMGALAGIKQAILGEVITSD